MNTIIQIIMYNSRKMAWMTEYDAILKPIAMRRYMIDIKF